MPLNILKKKRSKFLSIRVSTLDADLEFNVDCSVKAKHIFELVCHTVGLRETWYFGLAYTGKNDYPVWMKLDKKIIDQIPYHFASSNTVELNFFAKFYPEVLEDELIQEVTRHFFYLQFQKFILEGKLRCQPEASVLLASFAVQAKFGDFDEDVHKPGYLGQEMLLPDGVIQQFQSVTGQMWEEQITAWHAKHHGMTRDEAELEYLKIVQDFEMSGVNYFKITDGNGSNKWLGIDAKSVAVYPFDDQLRPAKCFQWSALSDMSYSGNKFIMKQNSSIIGQGETLNRRVRQLGASSTNLNYSEDLLFMVDDPETSKLILELCKGNHDLFMERRKVDSMEIQQMKAQAREEKMRKQSERESLKKEKDLRLQVQREKEETEEKLKQYDEENRAAADALRRSEETAELLAEKAKVAEEEAKLLRLKLANAEQEIQRVKSDNNNLQEMVHELQHKKYKYEQMAQQLAEESRTKAQDAEGLREELHATKKKLNEANMKLNMKMSTSNMHQQHAMGADQQHAMLRHNNNNNGGGGHQHAHTVPYVTGHYPVAASSSSAVTSHYNHHTSSSADCDHVLKPKPRGADFASGGEVPNMRGGDSAENIQQLSHEIEKERWEYQVKSRNIEQQLLALRSEIEVLKVDDHLPFNNDQQTSEISAYDGT